MLGWFKYGAIVVSQRTLKTLEDVAVPIRELTAFARAASEFLGELGKLPILQGKLVSATTDGTTNQNYFAHGLERPFMGAIMLGQNNAPAPIALLSPAAVANDSQDPALMFGTSQTVGTAATFTAWVF